MNKYPRWMGPVFGAILTVLLTGTVFLVRAECPPVEKVQEGFKKTFKRDVDVVKVHPSAMPGLCEAQVKVGGRNDVFYTDPEGKYFLRGPLFDVQTGHNITQEVVTRLNRLNPEEMKRLESVVAFASGTSPKVVYYVTDPQCPFCERGLKTLKPLIEQGKLTVKFVLFPLEMHKGAEEQCVAIICDNKGVEGLESKYQSDNQCREGKEKVKDAISLLKEKGISGTPAYIFEDGTYHVGVMQLEALLEK